MITLFFEGILLGLLVAISLGPAFFAIIQTGINKGFKHGVFMAMGISLSDMLLVTISYLIGAQLFDNPQNKVYVGLIGGIILIIFGSISWAKKPDILKRRNINYPTPTGKPLYLYTIRGFFLNVANPFLFFFWFGALGFVGKNAAEGKMLESTIAFFAGTFATIFATDLLKSYVGGKIKGFLRPRKEIILNKTVGIALVIFGVVLIFRTLDGIGFFEQMKGNLHFGKKVEAQYNVQSPNNTLFLTLYKDSSFVIKTEVRDTLATFSGDWTYLDTATKIFEITIMKSSIDTIQLPQKRMYQLTVTGIIPYIDSAAFQLSPNSFEISKDFTILTLEKTRMEVPKPDSLSNLCSHWSLTPLQFTKVIHESEVVNPHIWHYQFDFLPCAMKATIEQNNQVFHIELNAGAWFTVSVNDSSIYYGSYKVENEGLFLSTPQIAE
jgi:threonine/homoserine/homoserine lactone efflux protein